MTATADLTAPMTADEVRDARKALGFTSQEKFAEALGLTTTHRKDTVRAWESGRNPAPGPVRLAIRMMLKEKGLLPEPPKPKKKTA